MALELGVQLVQCPSQSELLRLGLLASLESRQLWLQMALARLLRLSLAV